MGISSSQNIEEQFKQDTETEESQDIISPKECIQNLQLLEKYIFSLNENNIQETSESTMKLFNKSFPYSWHLVICRLIFASFISQRKSINIFLDYLKLIDKKEEEIFDQSFDRILNVLTQFILTLNSRESDYVLMKMYEQNIVNQSILKRKRSIYFAQFLSDETFKMIQYNEINWNFKNVIKNVKENDWELHKKLIKEGHNPNEIAKIIRNDEIEKLQEISSQNNFDFDQIIEPSLYERYSFINEENVSLIDYAAFFGAIQCFKYLLMNNANVENTGKYAIAGGNLEIIHLCQQSCAKFKDTYETAIQFHQNDAFNYLYENKIEEINNLNYLGIRCIKYDNYEIFSFLENEGMEVDTIIINETIRTGNIFFANYFLEGKSYPKNSFFLSLNSRNVEFIQYLIKKKGFNINERDFHNFTPLMFCTQNNYSETVKLLLEQEGIDINAKNNRQTALTLASKGGNIEIVKLLLEHEGIDINAKEYNGNTALNWASENDYTEIIKLLLEHEGIDINSKDRHGWTLLMRASINGYTEIVKLLLEQNRIDINAKDYYRRTALMNASERGHTK